MAAPDEINAYFQEQEKCGEVIIHEPPKFDLDAYISNYAGRTRYERLFVIGTNSSYFSVEALKGAVQEAKQGKDVERYNVAVRKLREVTPSDPTIVYDSHWVQTTTKLVKAETDRLEFELKGYKNNLIKESIRMGNEDIGSHYHAIGDLGQAFRSFSRMREYCTSPKHILDMYLKLISVSVEEENWMAVQSNALKIANLQLKPEDDADIQPRINAARGLAQMSSLNYQEAALHFLKVGSNLGDSFQRVLSPNDVAVYGGLCALATMERNDLQKKVLDNASFRVFLELEPHIRRAITLFCSSKYSQCLDILESYKPDYLLDIHLKKHVFNLYRKVRSKSIVQYFIPFSCVTLENMSKAFAVKHRSIENELISMIKEGTLQARIDQKNKLLVSLQIDPSLLAYTKAMEVAKQYEQSAKIHLMRMSMIQARLEVQGPAQQRQH